MCSAIGKIGHNSGFYLKLDQRLGQGQRQLFKSHGQGQTEYMEKIMRTRFFLVGFLFLLTGAMAVDATCTGCQREEVAIPQKTYLQDQQIVFFQSKIYVNIEGIAFEVPAIYSDEDGYYILTGQPRGRCEPYEWKCGNCGTCNEFSYYYCRKCKREME
jgi:hypothetical protein